MNIFTGFQNTILSVVLAVLPLLALFVIFQVFMLKLRRVYVINILKGTMLASIGLVLFLQGVHIGLLPFGRVIGTALAALPNKWTLLPFGIVLGFLTTWGEPAVRILSDQVEEASGGSIRQQTVLYSICCGVALAVATGMLRIIYGIPLLYIVIPGYLFIIVIMWFSDPEFVSVAVDAGGVATGPIANTFLLSLALGLSSSIEGRDSIVSGLGLVALIALAPIISVMLLGLVIRFKTQ